MLISVSGPNFVTDPKKELARMDQTVHMTNYRRHDLTVLRRDDSLPCLLYISGPSIQEDHWDR